MKKHEVLFIDDDELFLYLTKESLKGLSSLNGIECFNHITDATEYLDSCSTNQKKFPDLIFLDLNMPGLNGLDFAELFRLKYAERFPQTKIVILTCSIYWKDKEDAMSIPCVAAFLQKPLTKDKVKELLLLLKS